MYLTRLFNVKQELLEETKESVQLIRRRWQRSCLRYAWLDWSRHVERAEHFCALVERLGVDVTRVEMVPTYVALLQDGEAEVRTAAAFNSTSFAAMLLAETVLTHLLPCYRELSSDGSPHVRGFEHAMLHTVRSTNLTHAASLCW